MFEIINCAAVNPEALQQAEPGSEQATAQRCAARAEAGLVKGAEGGIVAE